MPLKLNWPSYFDNSGDIPVQQQSADPANTRFVPNMVASARTILGGDGLAYIMGDQTVNPRGAKNVVWSSEAFVSNGYSIPALTANQKKATGLQSTNINAAATVPGSVLLDFSPYKSLVLMINLVSFTAGSSPTIQFELDCLDDSATPVSLALWKPAALSAAGSLLVNVGAQLPWVQSTAANITVPANYGVAAIPSGWTFTMVPILPTPNGQFQWTVTGTPTAIAWTAWIYGVN